MNILKKATSILLSAVLCASALMMPAASDHTICFDDFSITASAAAPSAIYVSPTSGNKVFTPSSSPILENTYYKAVFQTDGNLVVYRKSNGTSVYSTCTNYGNKYLNYRLTLQTDGNLVLYARHRHHATDQQTHWLWNTWTNSSAKDMHYSLSLNNSGQLVITSTYQGRGYTAATQWRSDYTRLRWGIINPITDKNDSGILQGDPLWAGVKNKGGSRTIGAAGCAITSLTMIYNHYKGTSETPATLNRAPFVNTNNGDTQFTSIGTKQSGSTFTANQIAAKLKNGPVVVHFGGVNNGHFVVVYGCSKKTGTVTFSDLLVKDPAGTSYTNLQLAMNRKNCTTINQLITFVNLSSRVVE